MASPAEPTNLTSQFEIVEYTGFFDELKASMVIQNCLLDNADPTKKHCSDIVQSWDLILRYRPDTNFQLTHFCINGPFDSVAPIKNGCLWVFSEDPRDADDRKSHYLAYSRVFNECQDEQSYSEFLVDQEDCARLKDRGFYFETDPVRLQYDARLNRPLVGKFIHLKFISAHAHRHIEVFRIVLGGFPAPVDVVDIEGLPQTLPIPQIRRPLPAVFSLVNRTADPDSNDYDYFRRVWNRKPIGFVFSENERLSADRVVLEPLGRRLQSRVEKGVFLTILPKRPWQVGQGEEEEEEEEGESVVRGPIAGEDGQAEEGKKTSIEERIREVLKVESRLASVETTGKRVCLVLLPPMRKKYLFVEDSSHGDDELFLEQLGGFVDRAIQEILPDEFRGGSLPPQEGDATGKVVEVVHDTFKDVVLDPSLHSVVHLYVGWSPACTKVMQIMDDLAGLFRSVSNVRFFKYNYDTNDLPRGKFNENVIPSIKIFPRERKGGVHYSHDVTDGKRILEFVLENSHEEEEEEEEGEGVINVAERNAELRSRYAVLLETRRRFKRIHDIRDHVMDELRHIESKAIVPETIPVEVARKVLLDLQQAVDPNDVDGINRIYAIVEQSNAALETFFTEAAHFRLKNVVVVETMEQFTSIIDSPDNTSKLVVAEFFARWIAPSVQMSDEFATLSARDFQGKVVFVRVDMEKLSKFRRERGYADYPYFRFFRSGTKIADSKAGKISSLEEAIRTTMARFGIA